MVSIKGLPTTQSFANQSLLKAYTNSAFQNKELESLTRYRFDKVRQCAKLKKKLWQYFVFRTWKRRFNFAFALYLFNALSKYERYCKIKVNQILNLARKSVSVYVSAKTIELRHTIKLIQILDYDIAEIEEQIQAQVQDSPIATIPRACLQTIWAKK